MSGGVYARRFLPRNRPIVCNACALCSSAYKQMNYKQPTVQCKRPLLFALAISAIAGPYAYLFEKSDTLYFAA